ncbi:GNAT family N-acetyltransferase [Lysinibacillus antri]|uniref:GNAT family N-acetyltransferase n=1 Tax=Lysinibacillus antri TaxID=2498145 RepID=A0A432L9N1_9BACI|nr:GNAT family N-acetyltransferase [Lysinibacillus antri]
MLQCKVITSLKDLEDYKEIWSQILERANNDNPFVEYEWIAAWWHFLGKADPVEIYVVVHKNTPIAFFPLTHTSRFGIHQFKFIGDDVATYMQVISEKEWLEPAIEYLLDVLTKKYKRLLFELNGLLESRESSKVLEKIAIKRQLPYSIFRVVTPLIEIEEMDHPDKKKKFKKKFKDIIRCENRFKSLGQLTFQPFEEKYEDMFQLYNRRWMKKIDTSGFSAGIKMLFFEHLANQKGRGFKVEINKLSFENKLIGFTYDICCRGRRVCYKMAHEPDFHIFGPGRIIERENLLKSKNDNNTLYDFGSGYEPYKLEWATKLDFTRKFLFSSNGLRERGFRNLLSALYTVKFKISSSHQYVEMKRDRFGEVLYFIKNATMKEHYEKIVDVCSNIFSIDTIDLYCLENQSFQPDMNFKEMKIQDILEHNHREELVPLFFKQYRLYSNNKEEITFLRNDQFIREESINYMEALPSNSTFIKDYDVNNLQEIVDMIQQEGLTIYTAVHGASYKKEVY